MQDKKAAKRRRLALLEERRMLDRYWDECKYLGSHIETEEERQERLKRKALRERKDIWQLTL